VENLRRILAIELVTAARGLDLRAPLTPGPGTSAALAVTREVVAGPGPDRFLAPELAAAEAIIASGGLADAVQDAVGALR
jgi:histidine ammonia-lyase